MPLAPLEGPKGHVSKTTTLGLFSTHSRKNQMTSRLRCSFLHGFTTWGVCQNTAPWFVSVLVVGLGAGDLGLVQGTV